MTALPPVSPSPALPVVAAFTIPEDNQELGEAITRLAGHINAAQYRFLKLLAAMIERDAWLGDSGMKSPAHWLNYYCGIDLGAAREKVRVALCLATLPLIDAAFSSGAVSYSKVRAVTRSATPANEAFLLQVARHGTAQHVEKLVRKFARANRLSDPQQDRCQYEAREFSWYHDDDDMLVFKGRLPAAEGAAFLKAMDAIMQTLGQQERASQGASIHEQINRERGEHEPAKDQHTAYEPTDYEPTDYERKNYEHTDYEHTDYEPVNYEQANYEPVNCELASLNSSILKPCNRESANYQPSNHKPIEPLAHEPAGQRFPEPEVMSADVSAATSGATVPTFTQKRADGLMAMADLALASLATDARPARTADKYQVVIHIDANEAKHVAAETFQVNQCTLETGDCHVQLAASTVKRLACDAALVTVLEDTAGNVLNVGRKTRTIPPAIRRALTLRDHGCRFPGCCETRFVDAHHIHHWVEGGETCLDNLILLCRHHHTLLHQQGFEIVQGVEGWEFLRPDGRKLPQALTTQFAECDDRPDGSMHIAKDNCESGLHIDARTAVTLWEGEAMDYGFAVGMLMDLADLHARLPQLMT